ncbi:hypothetical protein J2X54_002464 [Duganella sp. 3397]|nr:hypothetical protein [Duganella sp. 3397]
MGSPAGEEYSLSTPQQAFYIQSMLFNTNSALQSCSQASRIIRGISDGAFGLQDKKDVLLDVLHNMINHCGAISRYFYPSIDGVKGKGEQYKGIHKNRGAFLRDIFEIDEGSPLENRGLRNAIEHFDERLDIYLAGEIFGCIFPSLILGEPDDSGVSHHIFRAYYLKEGIFQILDERFHVQPIADELLRVHELLVHFDQDGGILRKRS